MSIATTVGLCQSIECYRRYARAMSLAPLVQLLTLRPTYKLERGGSRYETFVKQSSQMGTMDLRKGLDILRGFAFVGIVEEWTLSICLFHAIFGGNISQGQLHN
eukprot:1734600-Amphidinium_carterae.1